MSAQDKTSIGRLSTLGAYLNVRWYGRRRTWKNRSRAPRWLVVLLGALLVVGSLVALSGAEATPGFAPLVVAELPEIEPVVVELHNAAPGGQDLRWTDLCESDLRGASLMRASLLGANLSGADLGGANLENATLAGANVEGANLAGATLVRADLHWATLRGADLRSADLRWANLGWANLDGVDLSGADLRYASLERVEFRDATLPDGSPWTLASNLARFTDPTHPDFWPSSIQPLGRVRMRHLPESPIGR